VLSLPVMLDNSAFAPEAVLLVPVELIASAIKAGGGVVVARSCLAAVH